MKSGLRILIRAHEVPFLVPPKWVKRSVLANFPVEFRLPGTNRQNENGRTNLRSRVAGLLGKENLPCAASVDVNMGVAVAQMIELDPKLTQTKARRQIIKMEI